LTLFSHIAMIIFSGTRVMTKENPGNQLQAVDRWASRKRRSIEFLRQNGISGLIAKAREAGIRGTASFAKRQLRYHACSFLGARWDRKYGVDTSGQIDLVDIDVVGPNRDHGFSSVSTSPSAYAFLSAFFPADWKKFTFVDVGCGKGRVLMLAASQGFDTIIGIEFVPLICQVAEQNLARFSGRRPNKWSIVNADATTVDLPSGVPLLIYSFNPFDAEIWRKFIPALLKANEVEKNPLCLVLSGTLPDALRAAAAVIEGSARFRARAHGVTPFFVDAYAPYHYWIFDAI
jgi:predicted RNA methylase